MKSFDLQVNGCYGVDFNASTLHLEEVRGACVRLQADQCEGVLATFTTDRLEEMQRRLRRFVSFIREDELVRRMVAGFHIEGPFLNPRAGFRGAHCKSELCAATVDRAKALLDAGEGLVRLVTLAPEKDGGAKTTAFLASQGVVVSAGHCDPSWDELVRAADAGLRMATHVGNGCPQRLPRHDNVIQRLLALSDRLWCCFIGDGVHIPPFVLRNYLKAAGVERSILVTDAITPAGLGPGRFRAGHWDLVIGEDLVARGPEGGYLVGSTATMPRVQGVLQRELGLGSREIRKLIDENPRRALGVWEGGNEEGAGLGRAGKYPDGEGSPAHGRERC